MKAKIRGTEIFFDIAGSQFRFEKNRLVEKPVLFMLHGGPGGDHQTYKLHSLNLQKAAQLVFIDHRGCGKSKKGKQKDYSLENNIEDIEALRKYLGLEQISILGTSYGGMVASGYAIRYPKNIDKLILVATSPSYRFIEEAKKTLQRHGNSKQIAICDVLWKGNFKNSKQVNQFFNIMGPLYSKTPKQKREKLYSKVQTVWSHEALNEGFGGFLRTYDLTTKLKNITAPTLILAGDSDWITNQNQARTLAQCIPHAKLKVFKNCGHFIGLDANAPYLKLIQKFLGQKSRRPKRGKKK